MAGYLICAYLFSLLAVATVSVISSWSQPGERLGDRSSPEVRVAAQRCADLCKPICASGACYLGRHGCCSRKYCDAIDRSLLDQGITIDQPWGHDLPFMGRSGCVVPAHLRPICALYSCRKLDLDRLDVAVSQDQSTQYLLDHVLVTEDQFAGSLYRATTGVGAMATVVAGYYTSVLIPALPFDPSLPRPLLDERRGSRLPIAVST